jgi:radical SAM protein with 4Fe4S-binding SPASM domain
MKEVATFQRIVGNKLIRELFSRVFISRCKKDGDSFDSALRKYSDTSFKVCLSCNIKSKILGSIVSFGTYTFGADKEKFKEELKNPYIRTALKSVIRGISKFGVLKPFIPDAPFLVVWNFTRRCNLKCKHCYQSAGKEVEDVLTFEERKMAVETLYKAGIVALSFSGGEPLSDPDFFKIAKYAAEKGMAVTLATNGTLISEDIAKKLKEIPIVYAEVSLDYLDPEKHDEFRGVKGSWERTVEGIKNLVKNDVTTCIATFLSKENYEEIEKFVDFSKELGVKYFAAFDYKPTGRAKGITEYDLAPEQRELTLEKLARRAIEEADKKGVTIFSTAPQFGRKTLEISKEYGKNYGSSGHYGFLSGVSSLLDFIGGCGAGRAYIALQENGDITPCVYMPDLVVGNIKKDSFEKIWKENETFQTLRNREKLQGHCNICENKYVCGGCRARAYGYFGDITYPDPGCINNHEYWDRLQNKLFS